MVYIFYSGVYVNSTKIKVLPTVFSFNLLSLFSYRIPTNSSRYATQLDMFVSLFKILTYFQHENKHKARCFTRTKIENYVFRSSNLITCVVVYVFTRTLFTRIRRRYWVKILIKLIFSCYLKERFTVHNKNFQCFSKINIKSTQISRFLS